MAQAWRISSARRASASGAPVRASASSGRPDTTNTGESRQRLPVSRWRASRAASKPSAKLCSHKKGARRPRWRHNQKCTNRSRWGASGCDGLSAARCAAFCILDRTARDSFFFLSCIIPGNSDPVHARCTKYRKTRPPESSPAISSNG